MSEIIDRYEQGEVYLYGELTLWGLELYGLEYYSTDEEGNEIELRPAK